MDPRFGAMAMNFARSIGEGRLGLVMGLARPAHG
jgi:hypothetical protein